MLRRLLSSFLSTNGRCVVCQGPLQAGENHICSVCMSQLPLTNLSDHEENILERYFWGQIPIVRATSLFFYYKGADSHNILRDLKYRNQAIIGEIFGRIMATRLTTTSFFDGIDMIVPVPLSDFSRSLRNYNQAEHIAKGIHKITRLPLVTKGITRLPGGKSQTRLTYTERRDNVEGVFKVSAPDRFNSKHILLVDDVVTTGSTLLSLARAIMKGKDTRFSILTLAMSSFVMEVPYYKTDDREDTENTEEIYMPDDRHEIQ